MKNCPLRGICALFLSLCLALPGPAYGLRQLETSENQAGMEDLKTALAPAAQAGAEGVVNLERRKWIGGLLGLAAGALVGGGVRPAVSAVRPAVSAVQRVEAPVLTVENGLSAAAGGTVGWYLGNLAVSRVRLEETDPEVQKVAREFDALIPGFIQTFLDLRARVDRSVRFDPETQARRPIYNKLRSSLADWLALWLATYSGIGYSSRTQILLRIPSSGEDRVYVVRLGDGIYRMTLLNRDRVKAIEETIYGFQQTQPLMRRLEQFPNMDPFGELRGLVESSRKELENTHRVLTQSLSTEAWHMADQLVRESAGLTVLAVEHSEMSAAALEPVRAEAGDHLSHLAAGFYPDWQTYAKGPPSLLDLRRNKTEAVKNRYEAHRIASHISEWLSDLVTGLAAGRADKIRMRKLLSLRAMQMLTFSDPSLWYREQKKKNEAAVLSKTDDDQLWESALRGLVEHLVDGPPKADSIHKALAERVSAARGQRPLQRQSVETFLRVLEHERDRLTAAGAEEVFLQRLTPIVIGTGMEERYPELKGLEKIPGLPVVFARGRPAAEVVTELISRWDARRVVFAGAEEEAGRFLPAADFAGISTRQVRPDRPDFTGFLLAVVAEAAGAEQSFVAAQREFSDLADRVVTYAGQV